MPNRRDVLTFGCFSLAGGALTLRGAFAQPKYPDHSIKLVIPFAPGGATDAIARPWAEKMKALLGPVFIENQGGAGGLLAAAAVARANPDGYTLLLGSAGQVLISTAGNNAPYDPLKDLEPISILALSAMTIAVHPSLPTANLRELIDYARSSSGTLSYGSSGVSTMSHLAGELFKSLTGITGIVAIPYKGGGPLIADLISGHIPIAVTSVNGQVLQLHEAGKLRMLAVTAPTRIIAAPDVLTAVEAGLPGMIAQSFFGLFAPAGTPKTIVEQIADATQSAMADDGLRQKLIGSGFEPHLDSSPQGARRFVEEEVGRWIPIIKGIGSKLE